MPAPTLADCRSASANEGGNVPFFMNVTASVLDSCLIHSASDLDFGIVDSQFTQNIDQSTMIALSCPLGTPWKLSMNSGTYPVGEQRRMMNDHAEYIAYDLYRDSARVQRWSQNTVLNGVGLGQTQTVNVPVYGRVPRQSSLPSGSYNDHVTVTLTY
ncbi:Spore Coat Protein U domain protein [compost metagenome]